jgi:hypothetical protein
MLTALLTCSGLWIAFWNAYTSVDQQVLFEQARYLSQCDWTRFLEEFGSRPYIEYQPPFFAFWVSRFPMFWLHQVILFPFGLLCVGLMWHLYGRQAALLCATPVFALMIHQPSTDTILFGMLLIVLRLHQLSGLQRRRCKGVQRSLCINAKRWNMEESEIPLRRRRRKPEMFLAAFFYGLTWPIKPLTLLTAPFIIPQLGLAGIGSLMIWGGYLWWSQRWEFGRHQIRFLLHQLFIQRMNPSGRRTPRSVQRISRVSRLWQTFSWRWNHIGRHAVMALPFYLFPAWLRPWTWKGLLLAAVILLGYGNSKYLLLDLLFLFPVQAGPESLV